ncbi:MAG: HAMP domain-containing histidine kinase [Nitrospinae bacterium]|nr:HAMP domain-containing histidine kinase [Nitrospinota bacterium]
MTVTAEKICDSCKQSLDKADRAISAISHDIKSPMVAIAGFTEALLKETPGTGNEERWSDFLQRINKAAKASLALVEDILSLAKMEAGKEPVEPEWVHDLDNELKDIVSTFRMEAEAKGVSLDLEIKPLPAVRWDMRRLRYHAINNVLSNALKFTPAGGAVTLKAEKLDGEIILAVEDSGPGIPPDEHERIFNRFEQAGMRSHRVFKGAGLGLANARLFVERHGGRISVEDAKPHGARFVITLPVASNAI